MIAGYGIDEGAALHFVDDALLRAINSHPQATAYMVEVVGGEVQEHPMEAIEI